jgi:endonuclease/exonuclease/phosphatase family metal-dependent hydrolase
LVDAGDFWLSDDPSRSSKAWGATLPRVASWARFTTIKATGAGRAFAVLNAHLDHASAVARVESARLLRSRAHALSWLHGSGHGAHRIHAGEAGRHIRSSGRRSDDGESRSGSPAEAVVFVTGDFNAVKGEGGAQGWYALLTAGQEAELAPPLVDAWVCATERNCGACGQVRTPPAPFRRRSISRQVSYPARCETTISCKFVSLFSVFCDSRYGKYNYH